MRNIARFVEDVEITGITINAYQVKRGQSHIESAGFSDRCHLIHGDFMAMPLDDSLFDRAYALDATPHAPDRRRVYSEVFRVLRPGGLFGCFEWCVTDRYDPANAEHRAVIRTIDRAHVVRVVPMATVGEALADCGFEVMEARDVPDRGDAETPWYWPFARSGRGIRAFAISAPGARVMEATIKTVERLRVAPKGPGEAWAFMREGGTALLRAGQLGIFTPHYFFLARKPVSSAQVGG